MSVDVGLIVGLAIAAVVVIILAGAAIAYAVAERRRAHKKPHRTSNISGFIYDEHGQRKKVRGSRSEDWGLLEEARLEPFSDTHPRQASFHEPGSSTSMGPLVRPAEQPINYLSPHHSPTPPFFVAPRNTSPLLKTLPPLTIPSPAPRTPPAQPPPQSSVETGETSESASIYSQVSATTTMHNRLTQSEDVPPPLPPFPSTIPELPAHLRHYEPIDRSQADSRATIQRGDTALVGTLLKSRAHRAPESDGALALARHISRIERIGSIRDREAEQRHQRRQHEHEHELTGAFQRDVANGSSVASQSPAPSIMMSEYEMPTLMTVVASQQEAVHIQPLRIPSEKARLSRAKS